jgi:Synergist-CTERM protein sorting domain-containing protein
MTQVFQLDDSGTNFGTINLALTVSPDANGQSGDGGDTGDTGDDGGDAGTGNGGCSTSGGTLGWLALALPALVLRRRRR